MANNTKKTNVKHGAWSASAKSAKTAAASALTKRPAHATKAGRFAEGVKVVSKRDRDGLIKLADR